MLYKRLATLVLSFIIVGQLFASLPRIGAQVIIEPGQTDEEIELWFKRLNENGMTLCRIRMFEEYMRDSNGSWDFTLFDKAFVAAEKYGIKIFAGLFPSMPGNSIGGFKFPLSNEHEKQIREYIYQLVNHYKQFDALYGWVLINEPGTGGHLPETDYTRTKFEEWKENCSVPLNKSKGYTLLKGFHSSKFLVDYNTWYIGWLSDEITKYDMGHELHVNNHQIFENIAEYNFPAWRPHLTSLGASAHPSWHFGYFDRSQYTMALSANCNIIRSGAGNLPFILTELQGGNNTYTGMEPFCPTAEEITQWLWTTIATGAESIIFWSLNPRSIGEEAGEWALLDFLNAPSDRLWASAKVSKCIGSNKKLFSDLKPVNYGIYILYNRESLWIEKETGYGNGNDFEGRQAGGVIKSALAYYETLSENGVVPNIGEFAEFDWSREDYSGVSVILANTISIPMLYQDSIRNFVKNGGTILAEGLTGFYDENMLSQFNTGFPLADVFGATLKEIKCIPGDFTIDINGHIPVHLWKGGIHNISADIIAKEDNSIIAIRHQYGKGKVVWIPSLLGMGAWRSHNNKPLSDFLLKEIHIPSNAIRLEEPQKGIFMQTSKNDSSYISVVVNKSGSTKSIKISSQLKSKIVFSERDARLNKNTLIINSEDCVIIEWK